MTVGGVVDAVRVVLVVVAVVMLGVFVVPWLALWCMYGIVCLLIL